jgi:hypothetical protein
MPLLVPAATPSLSPYLVASNKSSPLRKTLQRLPVHVIEGDCFDVLKKRLKSLAKDAIVFASPPWGGMS